MFESRPEQLAQEIRGFVLFSSLSRVPVRKIETATQSSTVVRYRLVEEFVSSFTKQSASVMTYASWYLAVRRKSRTIYSSGVRA